MFAFQFQDPIQETTLPLSSCFLQLPEAISQIPSDLNNWGGFKESSILKNHTLIERASNLSFHYVEA